MLAGWLDLPPWAVAATLVAFYGLTAALLHLASFRWPTRRHLAGLQGMVTPFFVTSNTLFALTVAGLVLAAVPRRADARDALAGATLADLPAGARVATGSVRRRAQLAWLRPDLTFVGLRGNIGPRLERVAAEGAEQRITLLLTVGGGFEPDTNMTIARQDRAHD